VSFKGKISQTTASVAPSFVGETFSTHAHLSYEPECSQMTVNLQRINLHYRLISYWPGDWVAVSYNDASYRGIITEVNESDCKVSECRNEITLHFGLFENLYFICYLPQVKVMHPRKDYWVWPPHDDEIFYEPKHIVEKLQPPKSQRRGQFSFPK
jgi:hypothetical protein